MEETEFRKIIDKFINDSLTEKEQQLIDQYYDKLCSKTKQPYFKDEKQKVNLQESIWAQVSKHLKSKPKIKNWLKLASLVAVFTGLFVVYLYWQKQTNNNYNQTVKNAITLKFEDGTFKNIKEYEFSSVRNQKGETIGIQNKNQLTYVKNNRTKKLVYNTLRVPYGKKFKLILSDDTQVYINSGSSLKYPVQFLEGNARKVYVKGEVFFDVKKYKELPFIVTTDNLNIKVLGTKFNVHAYSDDKLTEIVLLDGLVEIGSASKAKLHSLKSKHLKPGYKACFDKKTGEITTNKVTTNTYISWMKGKLSFKNMTFNKILKKLERYYNIKIINHNISLSNKKFNANFGSSPLIDQVMEELKTTYQISFTIKNDTIIIK
ncbi:MAG: FecR family protein [Tenacibaculum sp.]